MKKYIYQGVLIIMLLGCNNDKEEIRSLLPNSIELNKTLNKELTATSFSEYSLIGKMDNVNFSSYPKDIWKDQGWRSRHWDMIKEEREKKDLITFLQEESSKYSYSGKNTEIVKKIDIIIDRIDNQSENYLISYFYKEKPGDKREPTASDETYTGWLFFYYLDLENKEMVRITNAYR